MARLLLTGEGLNAFSVVMDSRNKIKEGYTFSSVKIVAIGMKRGAFNVHYIMLGINEKRIGLFAFQR